MAKAWAREREYIANTFSQTRGNWDLYVAFLELGCNLLSDTGYLSFITPDKWISKDFGAEIRKRIMPGIVSILPVGRDVFESSLIDSIVTTVSYRPVDKLQVLSIDNGEVSIAAEIDKADLHGDEGFDQLLSRHYGFLRKLESVGTGRLKDIAETENACATSDTYVLGKLLADARSIYGYVAARHYKVANTGTLSRFGFRWGLRAMRYLKKDYTCPIVAKNDFKANLGVTYQRRAASSKIIIKGLTLLEAALDLDGSFIPGKSTLVICSTDPKTLKVLAGIINSRLASFYVKQKYASASYNEGVNFTPDMLNSIPIPHKFDTSSIVENVDKILAAQAQILAATSSLQATIRASGVSTKLRKQFDYWYELSTAEFIEELGRQGLIMSVRDKAEWAELLEEEKAKVAKSLADRAAADNAIDDIMFDAYGLDQGERDQLFH